VDNGRQERWYRTVKQEEIYCYPTYPSLEEARASLARYIHYYNEERLHSALKYLRPVDYYQGNPEVLLAAKFAVAYLPSLVLGSIFLVAAAFLGRGVCAIELDVWQP
jgi:hypothetical protein